MVQNQTDTICIAGVRIRGTSGPGQMSLPNPSEVAGEVRTTGWPPPSGKAAITTAQRAEMELRLCPGHCLTLL